MTGPPAILCDIDGTAAIMHDRTPYSTDPAELATDKPNEAVWDLLADVINGGRQRVIFVSARQGKPDVFGATQGWLYRTMEEFDLPPYYIADLRGAKPGHHVDKLGLLLREAGDTRPDQVVKRELYGEFIEPLYTVSYVLDDRDSVVGMWRDIGVPCFQVAPSPDRRKPFDLARVRKQIKQALPLDREGQLPVAYHDEFPPETGLSLQRPLYGNPDKVISAILGACEHDIRADENGKVRAQLAELMFAEFVCCDIYERWESHRSEHSDTYTVPESLRVERRNHAICFYGAWAACLIDPDVYRELIKGGRS